MAKIKVGESEFGWGEDVATLEDDPQRRGARILDATMTEAALKAIDAAGWSGRPGPSLQVFLVEGSARRRVLAGSKMTELLVWQKSEAVKELEAALETIKKQQKIIEGLQEKGVLSAKPAPHKPVKHEPEKKGRR
jgi:hypothetical protein